MLHRPSRGVHHWRCIIQLFLWSIDRGGSRRETLRDLFTFDDLVNGGWDIFKSAWWRCGLGFHFGHREDPFLRPGTCGACFFIGEGRSLRCWHWWNEMIYFFCSRKISANFFATLSPGAGPSSYGRCCQPTTARIRVLRIIFATERKSFIRPEIQSKTCRRYI